MSATSIGGGLDVNGIVSQLMYVENLPVRSLQTQKSALQQQVSAYDQANRKLTELFDAMDSLRRTTGFGAKSATSSNASVVSATANASAAAGVYTLKVTALATNDSHQIKGNTPISSLTQTFSAGTIDVTIGDGAKSTVTIDGGSTLEQIRDTINNADAGVTAFIVTNNGEYSLGLTSKTSGTAGAITLGSTGLGEFNFTGTHVAGTGTDAAFQVNGINFTNSTNTVTDAIQGLTLQLTGTTGETSTAQITVSDDTNTVKTKINSFVTNFNNLIQYFNAQFTYDTKNPQNNSPLAGDSDLRRMQDEILSMISQSVPGLNQSKVNLRQIGIELQNDGTLKVDDAKLTEALSGNFSEVQHLFQSFGATSTDANITYLGYSRTSSVAGSYEINIERAASQATATGANAYVPADGTLAVKLGTNTLNVTLSSMKTLSEVISSINTQAYADGIGVRARESSGKLEVFSTEYGSSQVLEVSSSVSVGSTGFETLVSATGVDVRGSFGGGTVVDGAGQILTAPSGNGASGISLKVQGTALGSRGIMTFSIGYADMIADKLNTLTDSAKGPLSLAKSSLNTNIRDIDDQIRNLQERLSEREQMYLAQYTRANQALAQMSALQSTLSQMR